jgi:hypothetical protein
MKPGRTLLIFLVSLTLAACGSGGLGSLLNGPTPMPGAGANPVPLTSAVFVMSAPSGTGQDAGVSLELVDPVTGLSYNADRRPMTPIDDTHWRVEFDVPVGSLLRYRYLRTAPETRIEADPSGAPIRYRLAYLPAPTQIEDLVAAWSPERAQGPAGRILGRLTDAASGQPVNEVIVTAGGLTTFSDAEGRFRLEGLAPGMHNLVVYHPDGAYRPAQQGAILAADSTTPAEIALTPATPVIITFQLTMPSAGQPVSLAGNLRSLGSVFAELPGGVELSAARLPRLIPVDDQHAILLAELFAGTDLRYKYTLGDGLWNAERDGQGAFRTRQWIVPETDAIIADTVEAWGTGQAPIRFTLQPPAGLADDETLAIQFDPFTWFEPLPLQPVGDGSWQFDLLAPLGMSDDLRYRYCRNWVCQSPDGVLAFDGQPDRRLSPVAPGALQTDQLDGWQLALETSPAQTVVAPEIVARPDFELGVELVPRYQPGWTAVDRLAVSRADAIGATAFTLAPTWILTGTAQVPRIEFDPARARYQADVLALSRQLNTAGLELVLRPELAPEAGSLAQWWSTGQRDRGWWTVYYEELRSFLVSQASLAQAAGASKLVLTGDQMAPGYPGGTMPDGAASGAPQDGLAQWEQTLQAVRNVFAGDLAYELVLSDRLTAMPPSLETFDEVHVYWRAPLATGQPADVASLQAEAIRLIDLVLLPRIPIGMPVVLSVEYLSVQNAASGCPTDPNGGCLPASEFDFGAAGATELGVDLDEQAEAINAVLLASADHPEIAGFYVRRYFPLLPLADKSASVHGKPAGEVLRFWFERLLPGGGG